MYLVKGILGESLVSVAPDFTIEDFSAQPMPVITHSNLLDYCESQRHEDDSSSSSWTVRTQIVRHRSNFNEYFYPRYLLQCTDPAVILLMAIRSNFFSMDLDIYDVQAGYHGSRFVPSSRMYLGTLECLSLEHGIFRFIRKNQDGGYIQLAAFVAFQQVEVIGTVRLWKAIIPNEAHPVVSSSSSATTNTMVFKKQNSQKNGMSTSNSSGHGDRRDNYDEKTVNLDLSSSPSSTSHHELTDKDEALERILVEVHRKYRLLPKGYTMFRSHKPAYESLPKKHFAASFPKLIPQQLKSTTFRSCDVQDKPVCSLTKTSPETFSCEFDRPMSTLLAFTMSLCQLQI